MKRQVEDHEQNLKELRRLIDVLDGSIVRQWNQLLETNDQLNDGLASTFDDLKQRVDHFDQFGIDDALDKIQSDPDYSLYFSQRWSVSQGDNDQALYIRDDGAINSRYKFQKGVQVDV